MLNAKTLYSMCLFKKLDQKLFSLLEIINAISTHVYCLALTLFKGKIYLVFYVSLLEPCQVNPSKEPPLPNPILVVDKEKFEIEEIVNSCFYYRKLQHFIK